MDNEQFQEFVVRHLMQLTDKVSSIEGKVSSLDSKVSSLETDMTSLKSTVLRIETRMENEIIDKIKILFDGHQDHEHRLNRLEQKLGINM